MPWTRASLAADLRALGLTGEDAVLVHSSFRALGPGGKPADLVEAVIETAGTALFPTHTWDGATPGTPPTFDVRTTPSAQVGIVPETARLRPGGVRSVHPTHSVVAFGPDAGWLTEGHFDGGICGEESPYGRLARHPRGRILLLGVGHERNTSLHGPEEVADVPGALTEAALCRVTGHDGVERLREGRFHTWRPRDLTRVEPLPEGVQTTGRVGGAEARLVDAGRLWSRVVERLRREPGWFWV